MTRNRQKSQQSPDLDARAHETGWIYILHLDAPLHPVHRAQHYVGWAKNVGKRWKQHRTHPTARFMQVALERGIGFTAHVIGRGTREAERRIKLNGHYNKLCPICRREMHEDDGIPF